MAFPQVEATNHSVEASNTTSHTVSLPASISSGETLLVFFSTDGGNTATFPEGWTKFFGKDNGSDNHLAIAWRKADGEEGASITVTTTDSEHSTHISYRISGAIDPTSTAPEVSTGATGDDRNPNPDSLTPGGGSDEYLWIAVVGNDHGSTADTYPTDYTDGETYKSDSIGACGVAAARRENETDSEDPNTFAFTPTVGWVACTVAVYPTASIDYPINTSCGLTASATIDRDVAWSRGTSPGLTIIVPIIGRALAYARATLPGLTAAVTIAKFRNRTITTNTALAISTTISRALTWSRATSPGLTAAVTVARKVTWDKVLQPALSVAVSVARALAWDRAPQPALSIAVSIAKFRNRTISITADLAVSALIRFRTMTYRRIVSFTNCKVMNIFTNIRNWVNHTNIRS